ncbi:hypothetical protein EGW08_020599 [Elysia chlorotica]|uniref:Zinc finger CCHC domain-containing protein 7 n=1 Tax=Elysia chlorotica TaxID=188477 RepID=A0A433SQT9_ELYCH|nr:hypothetical protein EGW08_020599 [Elysia chlorotica]
MKKEPLCPTADVEESLNVITFQRKEALSESFENVKSESFQLEDHKKVDLLSTGSNKSKTSSSLKKISLKDGHTKQGDASVLTSSKKNTFENNLRTMPSTSSDSFNKRGMGNKQHILPFEITKKIKVQKSEKNQLVVIEDDDLEETASHEIRQQSVPESKGKNKKRKDVPKLQDFLELSQSGSISKLISRKFVTKGEAAVKPRKPEVQLRRPPPAIPVRYKPDSDTETDYSDSDASCMNTPRKMRKENQDIKGNSGSDDKSEDSDDDSSQEELVHNDDNQDSDVDAHGKPVNEKNTTNSDVDSSESESKGDDSNVIKDDSADSDSSACALVDDAPVQFMPNLDFNLEGGVSELLTDESSTKPPSEDDLWKIDEKDRYKDKSVTSRYFAPRPIQCRNCRKNGHMSRDCPEPLKRRCIFCGEEGHQFKTCPQTICFNCGTAGHRSSDCKKPKMNWNNPCDRCWMKGHREEECPDQWRQLHLSLHVGKLVLRSNHKSRIEYDEQKNPRVYCYNCGKNDHWGHECWLQRMNRFVAPSYPFVAHYDRKSEIVRTMLPDGVSIEDARKDHELEKEVRRLERKQHKQDKHNIKAAKRKDIFSEELEKRRQSLGKISTDVSGVKPLNKKDTNRETHSKPKKMRSSYQDQDVYITSTSYRSEHQPERNSSSVKSSPSSIDQFRPSTSKAARMFSEPAFCDPVPSPRISGSRKRARDLASPEVESADSYDDMVQHQVGSNEWWLDKPDTGVKQKKRGQKKRSKNRQQQGTSPAYSAGDRNWESGHQVWLDGPDDLKTNQSLVPSPVKQHHTTFVYVDKQPVSYSQQPPDRVAHSHMDSPGFQHRAIHRPANPSQHHQFREIERSPPRAAKSGKHFKSQTVPNRDRGRGGGGRMRYPHHSHSEDWNSHGGGHQSNPKGRKHNPSASWPAARGRKKQGAGPASLNRGFQSKHDRFVTMKNDCDIKVSMRK